MLEDERIGHPALPGLQYVQVFIHRLKFCKNELKNYNYLIILSFSYEQK